MQLPFGRGYSSSHVEIMYYGGAMRRNDVSLPFNYYNFTLS
jgi:hypothetical protein